jgi:precorrin-2 dehydrogenase
MKKVNRGETLAGPARRSARLFPIFLKLEGRRCLAVGAGKLAEAKIESLLAAQADVFVVAPKASASVQRWAREHKLTWSERAFELTDLDGICVTVCATSSAVTNQIVFEESQKRGVLCSVADDAEHSDFLFPVVVERGALQIAVSTAGHSSALEQRLHKELEKQYGPEYESWLEWLGKARASLSADPLSPRRRRTLLRKLASERGLEDFLRRYLRVAAEQGG